MDFFEKIQLMDEFLNKIGDNLSDIPRLLNNGRIPSGESIAKFRIVEDELIKHNLVLIMKPPHTNQTLGGWGVYRISPEGLKLLNSDKSVEILYPEESKLNLLFKILQNLPDLTKNGISIYDLSGRLKEEPYKVRKQILILNEQQFVRIIDTSNKDSPEDMNINLSEKGKYAQKKIENLKEELEDYENPYNFNQIILENISQSIVNKGNDINVTDSPLNIGSTVTDINSNENSDPPTGKKQGKLIKIGIIMILITLISILLRMYNVI